MYSVTVGERKFKQMCFELFACESIIRNDRGRPKLFHVDGPSPNLVLALAVESQSTSARRWQTELSH